MQVRRLSVPARNNAVLEIEYTDALAARVAQHLSLAPGGVPSERQIYEYVIEATRSAVQGAEAASE